MSATTFQQVGADRIATVDLKARMRDAAYWSAEHLKNLMTWVRDLVRRICAKFGVVARWLRPGTAGAPPANSAAGDVTSRPSAMSSIPPRPTGDLIDDRAEGVEGAADSTLLQFVGLPEAVLAATGEFGQQIESILREPFVFDQDCGDVATAQKRLLIQVNKAECLRLAYVLTLEEADRIERLLTVIDNDDMGDPEQEEAHRATLFRTREEAYAAASAIAKRYDGIARSAKVLADAVVDPIARAQMTSRVHEVITDHVQRLDQAVERPLGASVVTAGFKPLPELYSLLRLPHDIHSINEEPTDQPKT